MIVPLGESLSPSIYLSLFYFFIFFTHQNEDCSLVAIALTIKSFSYAYTVYTRILVGEHARNAIKYWFQMAAMHFI